VSADILASHIASKAKLEDSKASIERQLEDKNTLLNGLLAKSEGKETEGTKNVRNDIEKAEKMLTEVKAEIAKERADIAKVLEKTAEQKQGALVVVVVVRDCSRGPVEALSALGPVLRFQSHPSARPLVRSSACLALCCCPCPFSQWMMLCLSYRRCSGGSGRVDNKGDICATLHR